MNRPVFYLLFLLIFAAIVIAPPPQDRTVRGTVYKADGITQASSGILVLINDTNSSLQKSTKTFGPPTQPGRYSAVISSVPGDLIYALAYNATRWGQNYGMMGNTQIVIDIKLNVTRDSEAKVQILYPRNHSSFDSLDTGINVTANITILGNDGIDCNATLIFSVLGVFQSPQTVDLGNMLRGVPRIVKFNITSSMTGVTNITVSSECSSDGLNLEHLSLFKIYNITNLDMLPPQLAVLSPSNNSRVANPVLFLYNVTDNSPIINCTLEMNSVIVNKTLGPSLMENFSYSLIQKYNNWSINCTDISGNKASSGRLNLTRNDRPYFSSIAIGTPINLNAGSNKTVFCNGTVIDEDSYQDIYNINATLRLDGINTADPLNRSNHYLNSSCSLFNGLGNSIDFRCSFELEYYAYNGTWQCNASAVDAVNATNTSKADFTVNQLLAFGISPELIDYGNLQIMQISPQDIVLNVTNYGNVDLDMNLSAYALVQGDGLALDCIEGTIPYGYERFDFLSGSYLAMIPISADSAADMNLTRNIYGTSASMKQVFWKIQIPFGVSGKCNGKVLFSAKINQ
jgi:hypothetical protein